MSGNVPQSLFFLQLPELKGLLSVTLSLQEDEEPRTRQIQTCRELVLLFQDVVAAPALDSFADITALMTVPFFQRGTIQAFAYRRHLQLAPPQCVFPVDLQRCLSYSLVTRLAPGWNKAGPHLICGKDFLTERGRLSAISFKLNTSNNQLCMSIEARSVRLPPTRLEDFGFPPLVLKRFFSDPDCVLDLGCTWCHVLPSMKKGQIISISRRLPADGPFRTNSDLQRHWNLLYGYRLPEQLQEEEVYCSVYFKLVGEKLFTYPLSCIRLQPVQCCPHVDLQGVLGCFAADVRDALRSVCGFPVRLTSKPQYGTLSLNPASAVQVSDGKQMNLTSSPSSSSSSSSIRKVLTQLPPPPPPPPALPPPRPGQSLFGSQPPASLVYQQDGVADKRLQSRMTQSQGCTKNEDWPSSSSSSFLSQRHASPPFISTSSVPPWKPSSSSSLPPRRTASSLSFTSSSAPFQPESSLKPIASLPQPHSAAPPIFTSSIALNKSSSSSASFLPSRSFAVSSSPFQPASSLNSTSSLQLHRQARCLPSSSSTPPPPPPPARPKLVPIFKNKHPSRHVNVALLRAKKEEEQQQTRVGGEQRVTLPPVPSAPAASLPLRPPPAVPRFSRQHKHPHGVPRPSHPPNVRHISSLSPKLKPGAIISPKPEIRAKTKPILNTNTKSRSDKTRTKTSGETQEGAASGRPSAAPSEPQTSTDIPNTDHTTSKKKKVIVKVNPRKSKPAVEDVEMMARNNQLSKLSSSSLSAWLKLRGVPVSAKLKKDELMLKVMSCLAEA